MNRATLRLVLFVSCAHALVHVYELSLPSVEQLVARDFHVGMETTGALGNMWRFPFGLCAFAAGWLVDRFGSKRLLVIYLAGCAATSILAAWSPGLALLFISMFLMGTFASIYHPAGLALISHETTDETHTRALGIHGIFGSVGIAGGPFIAAVALWLGLSWRQYYLLLALPGCALALVIAIYLRDHHQERMARRVGVDPVAVPAHEGNRAAFLLLIALGAMAGFIYAGLLNFLPRYLDEAHLGFGSMPRDSVGNLLTASVLLAGVIGQYSAGRIARPTTLEPLLSAVLFGMAPFLFWMAVADGIWRVVAAALFALVHFMHQPIYNSLVARYVSSQRRSLAYGVSNTMSFGVGSFGASFAGWMQSSLRTYSALAVLTIAAGVLSLWLLRLRHRPTHASPP
ncbi:MAG: MFS transporter [Pirellulales bacterium]|nr:MFS transporter [Pirellulales bacterium]